MEGGGGWWLVVNCWWLIVGCWLLADETAWPLLCEVLVCVFYKGIDFFGQLVQFAKNVVVLFAGNEAPEF